MVDVRYSEVYGSQAQPQTGIASSGYDAFWFSSPQHASPRHGPGHLFPSSPSYFPPTASSDNLSRVGATWSHYTGQPCSQTGRPSGDIYSRAPQYGQPDLYAPTATTPSPVPSPSSSYVQTPPPLYTMHAGRYFEPPPHSPALAAPFALHALPQAATHPPAPQPRLVRTSALYALHPADRTPPEYDAHAPPARPAAAAPAAAVKPEPAADDGQFVFEHPRAPPAPAPAPASPLPFVPTSAAQLEAPAVPSDVPLRATGAPPAMRRMMGAFRLDPFALHDGLHAALRPGTGAVLFVAAGVGGAPAGEERTMCWNGEEAGPLKDASALVEFQVTLDDPDTLVPNQVKYPHLFPFPVLSAPSSPEAAPRRRHSATSAVSAASSAPAASSLLYTLEPDAYDSAPAPWALGEVLPSGGGPPAGVWDGYLPSTYHETYGTFRQATTLLDRAEEMTHAYLHSQRAYVC